MDLLELMRHRRSIRKYTGERIPEEKLERVLQAALLAPTSMNKRPWEFCLVRDPQTLQKLSAAKEHGAALLAGCDAAVAVFADSSLSDVWVEDCSIALTYMDLAASEQGIGSCWVQLRNRKDAEGRDAEEKAAEILGMDAPFRIVGILALGMPAEEKPPYELDSLRWEKIRR